MGKKSSKRQRDAVAAMAAVLADSWGALQHLTCPETDTIVEVVARFGHEALAAEIILCHAHGETKYEGDCDEGDLHRFAQEGYWSGTDLDDVRKTARQYVAGLVSA